MPPHAWPLYPDYDSFPLPAQVALLDMIYNLGAGGLGKFQQMKSVIEAGQWEEAAGQCRRAGIQQARNDWAAGQFRMVPTESA